jgi:L-alanine-DL-glutamate epimerase-like enolase superfamily enzyme
LNTVEDFRITRFSFPTSRVIGDSQVRYDRMTLAALELESSSSHTGLGFAFAWAGEAELERVFREDVAPGLLGLSPFVALNRIVRPRGGNLAPNPFAESVDQALWDLVGKELGLPLYRLFGGIDNRVRAYASGLEFHLPLDEACAFYDKARAGGFRAFKFKVGHEDVAVDIERLLAFRDVVGPGATLMVDANEAWSPKEAIRRLHLFRDAGLDIFWVEDPCLRDDYAGLARVCREVPFTHCNTGEYLDLRGKWQLLEHDAVDILPVHGHLSEALVAAQMAAQKGIPVAVGNTALDIGVHLAAALPELSWLEWSDVGWGVLAAEPMVVEDGYVIAPERPGHGISLSEFALAELREP